MTINGILLDLEEWNTYIKFLLPASKRTTTDEYDNLYKYLKESSTDLNVVTGEYINTSVLDCTIKKIGKKSRNGKMFVEWKKHILEMRESMNGLSWFTWPCCSQQNGKMFFLGKRLDSENIYEDIDEIFEDVVLADTLPTQVVKEDLPDMFKDKEIITIYMCEDCISCT